MLKKSMLKVISVATLFVLVKFNLHAAEQKKCTICEKSADDLVQIAKEDMPQSTIGVLMRRSSDNGLTAVDSGKNLPLRSKYINKSRRRSVRNAQVSSSKFPQDSFFYKPIKEEKNINAERIDFGFDDDGINIVKVIANSNGHNSSLRDSYSDDRNARYRGRVHNVVRNRSAGSYTDKGRIKSELREDNDDEESNLYQERNFGKYGTDNKHILVNVGKNVVVKYLKNQLKIETQGVALDSGSLGDEVRVRNISSNKIVRGRINSSGEVIVNKN